jgi:ribosomal-protein-alanine N-acetyltransferase
MKEFIETERLILRKFHLSDVESLFELDSNVEVHRYLGNNPMQTIDQAKDIIEILQLQYSENNIGRWATIEKATGHFIGWSGLKLVKETWNNHTNYFDVGYRFIPKYWGKGYATESTVAALEYGFENLKATEIIGSANIENKASRRVLEKCGLKFIENFYWKDIKCDWLNITYEEWAKQQNK